MNTAPQKNTVTLIVVVGIIILVAVLVKTYSMQSTGQKLVTCTMEAKLCPDGSSVGRSGPKCEFAPCPTADTTPAKPVDMTNWQKQDLEGADFTLSLPPDLQVSSELQKTLDTKKPYSFNFVAIRGVGGDPTYYQLYCVYPFDLPVPKNLQEYKSDLDPSSIEETTIAGHVALKGQLKGMRNRFVTYILASKGVMKFYTAEPTPQNKQLTDQILSTIQFIDVR